MNLQFFSLPLPEQRLFIKEAAARRGVSAVMMEKDFWVSWTLALLFSHPEFGKNLVFKGGTSLSKVFGVIQRFSEDIDLSIDPSFVGISEGWLGEPETRRQIEGRLKALESKCVDQVRDRFLPELDRLAQSALGTARGGRNWMEFFVDPQTHSPVILFHYPCLESEGLEYLRRNVKMEFGSLTDQRPVGKQRILPWMGEEFKEQFADFHCELTVLELERTFWEKATILHSEHHRKPEQAIRDRFSRHYSDMAALARHPVSKSALAQSELRKRVVDWKSRFFASTWSRYDLAVPGTFRLAPPDFRIKELEEDYSAMKQMFLSDAPSFVDIVNTLRDLENQINN